MENRQVGFVKFYNSKKGFGFICIETEMGKKDIFFHCSELSAKLGGSLAENQKVTFLIFKGKKGFEARAIDSCN
jgi:CspA family cold shock protein